MKLKVDDLGTVGIVVDDWAFEKSFKPKTIVTDYTNWRTYISRRAVPKHILLTNTYYWKPILKPFGEQTRKTKYSKYFEENNLLVNSFFASNDGWTINNCSIEDNVLNINGKGFASQEYNFIATHLYMVVCYAKIDELNNTIKSGSPYYYSRAGIGFRVRSNESYRGAYPINIDDVSIEHIEDYVPIIFVFRNTVNAIATLSFGELYAPSNTDEGGNSTIKGSIAHVGLYDITNFHKSISYEKLYFEYKNWIEEKLDTYNASKEIVYPDSIAKEAFIESINDVAKYSGMWFSDFRNPSGIEGGFENFNNSCIYETVLQPTKTLVDKLITISSDGQALTINNPGTTVFFYDIILSNRYIVSNWLIRNGNRFPLVTYWNGNDYECYDFAYYTGVATYQDEPQRTDYTQETIVNAIAGATSIAIASTNDHTPVFKCYSQAPINASSVRIENNEENRERYHLKDNLSTCRDLAILGGVMASKLETQEIFSNSNEIWSWFDSYGRGDSPAYRNYEFLGEDWFIVGDKGGAALPGVRPDGISDYRHYCNVTVAKSRTTGKWYSVALARQDYLPDYNLVDNVRYTDAQLQEQFPDIYARKNANITINLIKSLLDFSRDKQITEITSFEPVEGTIDVNNNEWSISVLPDRYTSIVMDISEHRGKNCVILGNVVGRYTFLTEYPVEGQAVSYATGYSTFNVYSSEYTVVPQDAVYLVVRCKEVDIDSTPTSITFTSRYDFSEIDWNQCCVYEVMPDVPYAVRDKDVPATSKTISMLNKWFRYFDGKNMNAIFKPYSTTKMLTAIVALRYLRFSDNLEMSLADLTAGSGYDYGDGETIKVNHALSVLLYNSDNSIATALSRKAGYEILKGRKLLLLDKTVVRYS